MQTVLCNRVCANEKFARFYDINVFIIIIIYLLHNGAYNNGLSEHVHICETGVPDKKAH